MTLDMYMYLYTRVMSTAMFWEQRSIYSISKRRGAVPLPERAHTLDAWLLPCGQRSNDVSDATCGCNTLHQIDQRAFIERHSELLARSARQQRTVKHHHELLAKRVPSPNSS